MPAGELLRPFCRTPDLFRTSDFFWTDHEEVVGGERVVFSCPLSEMIGRGTKSGSLSKRSLVPIWRCEVAGVMWVRTDSEHAARGDIGAAWEGCLLSTEPSSFGGGQLPHR